MKNISQINEAIDYYIEKRFEWPDDLKKDIVDEFRTLIARVKSHEPGLTNIKRRYIGNQALVSELCEAIKANCNIINVSLIYCCINTASLELLGDNNSIKTLCLGGCNLDDHAAKILSRSKSIEYLYLWQNNFKSEGAAHFAKFNSKLQTLDLSFCALNNKAAIHLSKSKTITQLLLKNNQISSEGVIELARSKSMLQYLDLSNNFVGNEGANAFFEDNKTIKYLYLSGNKITAEGTLGIPKNTSLYSLDLSNNDIGDEGAKNIAQNHKIVILKLWRCGISDKGAADLGSGSHAAELNLHSNNITDEGAIIIAQNRYIIDLNLSRNYLGSDAADAFSKNKWITDLDLDSNYIGGYNGVKALARNSLLTYCYVNNASYVMIPLPVLYLIPLPSSLPKLDTVLSTAGWIFRHSAYLAAPFVYQYLSPKIDANKANTKELVSRCKSRNADYVNIWINEKHVRPYGGYFDSLLKTKGTVLHFAVIEKDTALLQVLVDKVPPSLLYIRDDVIDGLTFEELAEKNGLIFEPELKAAIQAKRKQGESRLTAVELYSNQIIKGLKNVQITSVVIAEGGVSRLGVGPSTAVAVANLSSSILSGLIKTWCQRLNQQEANTLISWLKDLDDAKKLADYLIGEQSLTDDELIPEHVKASFDEILHILNQENLQGRSFSDAEKRATIHTYKLINFMKLERPRANIKPSEWRDALLRAVMGAHHNYSYPAPQETRAQLKEKLEEKDKTLEALNTKLSSTEGQLKKTEELLDVKIAKVNEMTKGSDEKDQALKALQERLFGTESALKTNKKDLETERSHSAEKDKEIAKQASTINSLEGRLGQCKNIPKNVRKSWQPDVGVSGATQVISTIGWNSQNSASHSNSSMQAANSAPQTGAQSHAKL